MQQLQEAEGAPPSWVLDPRKQDTSSDDRGSHAISARFFLGSDPRGDDVGNTHITEDGSVPVIEMVEIINRNDPKNIQIVISTDHHRYRRRDEGGFPEEYARFKQGLDVQASGTPIKEWLGDNARTKNLEIFNIYTLEQLAAASDGLCQTLGAGSLDLRRKAQAFLTHKRDSGAGEAAIAERDALRQEMTQMRQALALLTAQNQQQAVKAPLQHVEQHPSEDLPPTPEKRGPGRPRVNQEN